MTKKRSSKQFMIFFLSFSFFISFLSYVRLVGPFSKTSVSLGNLFLLPSFLPGNERSLTIASCYIMVTFFLLVMTAVPFILEEVQKQEKKWKIILFDSSFVLTGPASLFSGALISLEKGYWFSLAPFFLLGILFVLTLFITNEKFHSLFRMVTKWYSLLMYVCYVITLLFWPIQPPNEMP